MRTVVFIEIDVDYCELTYGAGSCTAATGTTGAEKCFNTLRTCQVKAKFAKKQVTIRFGEATARDVYPAFNFIPCLKGYSFNAGSVSLGEGLGTRSTLTVELADGPDGDTLEGFDKYHSERSYDPFTQGTLFGKFRARQPYLYGRKIRLITGEEGQTLNQMETRHFILDKFEGPSLKGTYSLVAKDALVMANSDKAKAPRLSNGFLVAPIDENSTQCTLSPAGIGNIDYFPSGLVAIGGKEICRYTRNGDVLTLTRGQINTDKVKHNAQDRVQQCLEFVAQDPAVILHHLYVNYAKVPQSLIPLDAWKNETESFLKRLYSAVIAEPTGVDKLAAEIIQQAALANWWDDVEGKLKLQVLRKISTDAASFTPSNTLEDTLIIREKPDRRISQVWTYFGQINPLKKVDDPENYRSSMLSAHLERQDDYGAPSIKVIYGRWIPAFGRQVASKVNAIQLGRYLDAPRQFNFEVFRDTMDIPPRLVGGYQLSSYPMQTATGGAEMVPIQITKIRPDKAIYEVEAEEFQFVEIDDSGTPDDRVLIIDANTLNFNLRDAYNHIYPAPVSGTEVICIVEAGAIVGSRDTSEPSFDVGVWPAGVKIIIRIKGRVQGKGGKGGLDGPRPISNGESGGLAFKSRYPVKITEINQIWGGGGGGGLGGGLGDFGSGGGQGYLAGESLRPRIEATSEVAGIPQIGGKGGDAGGAGQTLTGLGGAAGAAIDGNSFITFEGPAGDIRGPLVN
ncbi:hypothetical protein [Pseudochrobactrum sp. MP213Fo]|uniref:hypothetical protein n=1 Tax=Pseudochrobactrum sp. MP213Fo TaxID=3022250 RepID=UPI003BA01B6F